MEFNKEMLRLYAITDSGCISSRDICQCVEAAIKGGATIIQLRAKELEHDELTAEAKKLKVVCKKYNVPLIVNDDYAAALEAGADGVHVGIEDAPVSEIRRIAGSDFIIGATAKTVQQAQKAQSEGADYIGVGAVFPSPTKKNAIRITLEQFREIAESAGIPAVAIGGISAENISSLNGYGASGAAVVSAVFGTEDIENQTRELRKLAEEL